MKLLPRLLASAALAAGLALPAAAQDDPFTIGFV
jgi:ABC-type sugar transport system substrate-binding protein